jgi:hypothetical protein
MRTEQRTVYSKNKIQKAGHITSFQDQDILHSIFADDPNPCIVD